MKSRRRVFLNLGGLALATSGVLTRKAHAETLGAVPAIDPLRTDL